ncbi:MAG TPA: DUF4440 domain-containing protein [Lichenihabitans sp.]|jgi:ketosteroid isomerase-like protein|nr:DUF4440 domain-containing protein [Lichenihabitans sp.]
MTDANQNPATLAFNEALASAFASGDFQAVGKAFVEDAVVLPPRGRPIRGRDAIAMFWNGFSSRSAGISFATGETKAIGETIIRETGTLSLTPRNEGGQPASGKFLFLWLKAGDDWLLESAMWTRNNGEQGRQGGGARQGGGGPGANRQGGGQSNNRQGGQGAYRQDGYRQGGYQQQGGYRRNRGGIGGQAGGVGGGGAGVGGMGGQQRRGGQRGQGGQQGQGGQRGQGGQGGGSQNLYDQHLGLYSNRDD